MRQIRYNTVFFSLTGEAIGLSLIACKDKKSENTVSEKPMNILYIMCHDHSYQTISAYDRRFIETPNIDRIATEGGVHFYNDLDCWELYDLQNDPAEMHNLYGQEGTEEITKQLKEELLRLQVKYDDPIRESLTDVK